MDMSPRSPGSQVAVAAHPPARIRIVDPDPSALEAVRHMLVAREYAVDAFLRADAFLASHDPVAHGCVILDAGVAGPTDPKLLQALAAHDDHVPVIIVARHVDVPTAVGLVRNGAFDVLTKPIDDAALARSVGDALEEDRDLWWSRAQHAAHERRLATLTRREREVLDHVMCGRLNKQIAWDLGTTEKTVKVHRGRIMEKMQVRTAVELARLVERTLASSEIHSLPVDANDRRDRPRERTSAPTDDARLGTVD
jgi:FixJ family two-component response regulator